MRTVSRGAVMSVPPEPAIKPTSSEYMKAPDRALQAEDDHIEFTSRKKETSMEKKAKSERMTDKGTQCVVRHSALEIPTRRMTPIKRIRKKVLVVRTQMVVRNQKSHGSHQRHLLGNAWPIRSFHDATAKLI